MTPETTPLVYFGKLPSRGDFVRARAHISETTIIDQWVSQALSLSEAISQETPLANYTSEKKALDETLVLNFSHIDTNSKQIITGVLIPSHDSSHRKYPFVGFSLIHLDKPKRWMNYLPIKSLSLWDGTYQALSAAKYHTDDIKVTEGLTNCLLPIDKNASTHYYDFINNTTLQDIALLMNISKSQLIQQIIATGLLFLPTFTKGFNGLNKSIRWALTIDKTTSIYMATFWHDLIYDFYQPHQLYLNTYFYRSSNEYQLVLSFIKPEGHVLSQLLSNENASSDNCVAIADSLWTQVYIDKDIGLTRFNKILSQEDLYLYDARQLFKQTFLAQ